MRLRIHRSDGKTGSYHQDHEGRATMLTRRFDPRTLFRAGPIVVGVFNPFTLLNPDEVCWIEVDTDLPLPQLKQQGIDSIRRLDGREHYESLLAERWPHWIRDKHGAPGDPLEALVELSLRGGGELYLEVRGRAGDVPLIESVFCEHALCAVIEPQGVLYINPRCIVRARIYHSRDRVEYPNGIWVAEADEV